MNIPAQFGPRVFSRNFSRRERERAAKRRGENEDGKFLFGQDVGNRLL